MQPMVNLPTVLALATAEQTDYESKDNDSPHYRQSDD